jgi:hypothetical protein
VTAMVVAPVLVAAQALLPIKQLKLKKAFRNSFYKTFENSRCSPFLLVGFFRFSFRLKKKEDGLKNFSSCPSRTFLS